MASTDNAESLLENAGIRVTANRLLVTKALIDSSSPLSMGELEIQLDTLEKSSVFRVLTLLLEHGIVHAVEDGRGVVRYEICHSHGDCSVSDMHAHFFCESCHAVTCFEDIPVPAPDLPDGYQINAINYMIKGLCPKCINKDR
ncbi:MAG: transcriptional repressor [Muribaculaceae bacterium]|nr:transcriptional repressor [Muribaculaceae bacterium]